MRVPDGRCSLPFCFVLFAACSAPAPVADTRPQEEEPGTQAVAYANFVERLLQLRCDVYEECAEEFGQLFPSRQDCLFVLGETINGEYYQATYPPSLFYLDEEVAQTCLDGLRARTCNAWHPNHGEPACDAMWVGKIAEGACCDPDSQVFYGACAPGLDCDRETERCVAPGAEGEPCLHANRYPRLPACESGLVCDELSGAGICVSPLAEGSDCSSSNDLCAKQLFCDQNTCTSRRGQGLPCEEHKECEDGLSCDANGGGTCVPNGQVGDICAVGHALCQSGLFCEYDVDANSYRCFDDWNTLPRSFVGDPCNPDIPYCPGNSAYYRGYGRCIPDSEGTYRCTAAATEVDEACATSADETAPYCSEAFGLYCNTQSNLCEPGPTLGEDCTGRCAPSYENYCAYENAEADNGTCVRRGAEGDLCPGFEYTRNPYDLGCRRGFTCVAGVCQRPQFTPLECSP